VADELLEGVRTRALANSFWQTLGIDVEAAGEGWVRLRMPVRDGLRNAPGAPVHSPDSNVTSPFTMICW